MGSKTSKPAPGGAPTIKTETAVLTALSASARNEFKISRAKVPRVLGHLEARLSETGVFEFSAHSALFIALAHSADSIENLDDVGIIAPVGVRIASGMRDHAHPRYNAVAARAYPSDRNAEHAAFVGMTAGNSLRESGIANFAFTYGTVSRNGKTYLLTENIRGESLRTMIDAGADPHKVIHLMYQIFLALSVARRSVEFVCGNLTVDTVYVRDVTDAEVERTPGSDNFLIPYPNIGYMVVSQIASITDYASARMTLDSSTVNAALSGSNRVEGPRFTARGTASTDPAPDIDVITLVQSAARAARDAASRESAHVTVSGAAKTVIENARVYEDLAVSVTADTARILDTLDKFLELAQRPVIVLDRDRASESGLPLVGCEVPGSCPDSVKEILTYICKNT